jgi:hypothetical protein
MSFCFNVLVLGGLNIKSAKVFLEIPLLALREIFASFA